MKRYLLISCLLILLILPFRNSRSEKNSNNRDFISYISIGYMPTNLYKSNIIRSRGIVTSFSYDQYYFHRSYLKKIRIETSYYDYDLNISMFSAFIMFASNESIINKFIKNKHLPITSYVWYDNGLEYPSGGFGIFRNYSFRKMFRNNEIELIANIFASINPLNWHEKQMILAPGIIVFPQMLIRYRDMHINFELFSSYSYGIKNSKKYYRIYPRMQLGYSLKCKVRNLSDD